MELCCCFVLSLLCFSWLPIFLLFKLKINKIYYFNILKYMYIYQTTSTPRGTHSFPVNALTPSLIVRWGKKKVLLSHWRVDRTAKISALLLWNSIEILKFYLILRLFKQLLIKEKWLHLYITLGSQILELELKRCNSFFTLFKCALELKSAVKLVNFNCPDSENVSSRWNKTVLKPCNLIQIEYITK